MLVALLVLATVIGLITVLVLAVRPEDDKPEMPIAHSGLSNADLCRAWQESFDALRKSESPAVRLRIVEARQRYLDELERRDPDGLHAWLESNASPAGNPARFVQDH
jgi:hypothetical protein